MQKSRSRGSIYSQPRSPLIKTKVDALQTCQNVQATLEEAARKLPHLDFAPIFQKTMKQLMSKAEVQGPSWQAVSLETVKQSLSMYGGSLQLNMRALLLEILSDLNCNTLQEIPTKLNKAKHIVLQTQIQYLLSKIFLLESRYYQFIGEQALALKSLKKCLELNEDHMVQFMQQEPEIRKQIVDLAIMAYHEFFKLMKNDRPQQALDQLLKGCNAAKKNYGKDHRLTRSLLDLYHQQQNILSMDRCSVKSRAVTDILDYENKKNYRTAAFYSWEDEKIVVQLVRVKGKQKQVISQQSYQIKLDMNKIKMLRSNEWITVERGGHILIHEQQLLKMLGMGQNESHQKQMTTGIELRNLSRDDIIKKNYDDSSEDDEQFFSKQQLNILKFPRAQSSRKFKQTQ